MSGGRRVYSMAHRDNDTVKHSGNVVTHIPIKSKGNKLEWVETISNFLVKNMGFFFVPPGVALMLYFDIIKAEIGPIVIATATSTIIVLVVTGWTHIATRKIIKTIKEKK